MPAPDHRALRATTLAALLSLGTGLVAQPAAGASGAAPGAERPPWMAASIQTQEQALVASHGETERGRIATGLAQVADCWRAEDGSTADFAAFVETYFAPVGSQLDALFTRMESNLESLDGHLLEVSRDWRSQSELELGPAYAFDELMAGYAPGAHFLDDSYRNKLAFVVLLNFPLSTLEQRQSAGATWTRRQWAEARLADRFAKRIPAGVSQAYAEASAEAETYIAGYNLWAHHLLDARGQRPFAAGKRLLSHWNLRDELKAHYARGKAGLDAQRTMARAMERIVDQTIPACVVDNPFVDWNPFTNEVKPAAVKDSDRPAPADLKVTNAPEPDRRYEVLLKGFQAVKLQDPYSLRTPTHIARSFEESRQLPEARVKKMLEDICGSPRVKDVARVIEKRLGRKLEPFDIWYNGLRPASSVSEAELDAITRQRYPTPAAFDQDLPNILKALGFSEERAAFLAGKIEVDPARGSGHAAGAARRDDNARLRTRVGRDGMDYKGFNIAVHELGHNVEQVFGLNLVDHTLLQGVPNTAFTEAMAYTFQNRDLEILGVPRKAVDAQTQALRTLGEFWQTYEISGVSLVDMAIWHWMYDHPDATPAELKVAVLRISRDVWNAWFAPVFGRKDCTLLAVYSHIVHSFLYLPDYAVGHFIGVQVEAQIAKSGDVAAEVERMCRIGNVAPDLWMTQATGSPVGPEALLAATAEALKKVGR
jgi:hypothetical protein